MPLAAPFRPVGCGPSLCPAPMPLGHLMYTRAKSLPSLSIRNIISDDMNIPLLGYRALSGWGYTDFHASVNFAFWGFSEVHGPEKWPPGRCTPASCTLRYFCNVTGRGSDTVLPPLYKKGRMSWMGT